MKRESDRKILIVDDEDVVRLAMSRSLQSLGYSVFSASSGADGLAILEAERGFDLIVSDHLMPNMSGLEFLKTAHRLYPDTLRMLVTGYADVEMAIDAINEGEISRFITKPWDNTDLSVALALAFEKYDKAQEDKRLAEAARRSEDGGRLEAKHPGITSLHKNADGRIVISEEEMDALGDPESVLADMSDLNGQLLAVH